MYTFFKGRGRLKLNQGDGAPLNPFAPPKCFSLKPVEVKHILFILLFFLYLSALCFKSMKDQVPSPSLDVTMSSPYPLPPFLPTSLSGLTTVTVHAISGWVAKHSSRPGPLLLQHEDTPASQLEACKWQIVLFFWHLLFCLFFSFSICFSSCACLKTRA